MEIKGIFINRLQPTHCNQIYSNIFLKRVKNAVMETLR